MEKDVEPIAFTIEQAARYACISRSTLFVEIRNGRIKARKHGRRTLIERAELDRFVRDLPAVDPAG